MKIGVLVLQGLSIDRLSELYKEMRTFLNITAKRRDKFSSETLSQRISKIDKYQDDLKTLSEMQISTNEHDFHVQGYLIREWAINKYHNFIEQREKYGI